MKLMILALLSLFIPSAIAVPLNRDIMDRLAAQIPIPTTPRQMHKAIERYIATVDMFQKESSKYRLECYKMFSKRRAENESYLLMVYGTTPDRLCDHLSTRLRRGYPVPEVQMILKDIDD